MTDQSDNVLNLHYSSTSLQRSGHNNVGSKTKSIRPRPRPVWDRSCHIRLRSLWPQDWGLGAVATWKWQLINVCNHCWFLSIRWSDTKCFQNVPAVLSFLL